jgi:DNA-binding CsgD family transcriptional regulator
MAILPRAPTRSCARCGKGFRTLGRAYSCPACRGPTVAAPEPARHELSFREQQVVALIRQAKTNKEIAYELCLAEGTVKEYLYRIFRKLAVTNRTELALLPPRGVLPLSARSAQGQRCLNQPVEAPQIHLPWSSDGSVGSPHALAQRETQPNRPGCGTRPLPRCRTICWIL